MKFFKSFKGLTLILLFAVLFTVGCVGINTGSLSGNKNSSGNSNTVKTAKATEATGSLDESSERHGYTYLQDSDSTEGIRGKGTEDTTATASATETPQTPAPEPEIKFTKTKKELKCGKSFQFTASVTGSESPVKYTVNKTKLASISSSGVLKAKKYGKVKVTATSGDLKTTCKVKLLPKKIVCIDPGHSTVIPPGTEPIGPGATEQKAKDNSGTAGNYTRIPEYVLNLAVSKMMLKILEDRGYKVVLTRYNHTTGISCKERAQVANKAGADIFVRIHGDSTTDSSVKGASAHYPTPNNRFVGKLSPKCKKLSQCVLDGLLEQTKGASKGLFGRDDLSGNNWMKMPVTLIEVGFMSNPTEDRLLATKEYRYKCALGMCNGIDDYFGF